MCGVGDIESNANCFCRGCYVDRQAATNNPAQQEPLGANNNGGQDATAAIVAARTNNQGVPVDPTLDAARDLTNILANNPDLILEAATAAAAAELQWLDAYYPNTYGEEFPDFAPGINARRVAFQVPVYDADTDAYSQPITLVTTIAHQGFYRRLGNIPDMDPDAVIRSFEMAVLLNTKLWHIYTGATSKSYDEP
jgi:hypothetical protein